MPLLATNAKRRRVRRECAPDANGDENFSMIGFLYRIWCICTNLIDTVVQLWHNIAMRMTLTLDRDVEKRLEKLEKIRKETKRALINGLLRESLDRLDFKPNSKKKTYSTKSRNLGVCRFGNIDDISEVLAVAEGEDFK